MKENVGAPCRLEIGTQGHRVLMICLAWGRIRRWRRAAGGYGRVGDRPTEIQYFWRAVSDTPHLPAVHAWQGWWLEAARAVRDLDWAREDSRMAQAPCVWASPGCDATRSTSGMSGGGGPWEPVPVPWWLEKFMGLVRGRPASNFWLTVNQSITTYPLSFLCQVTRTVAF